MLAEEQSKRGDNDRAKENYSKSVAAYDKSLALNSLQPDAWFSMGCAASRIDDYATAARAFRRKVDIDADVCAVTIMLAGIETNFQGFPIVEQSSKRIRQAEGQAQGVLCF